MDDISKAAESIQAWRSHLMRSVVQDKTRVQALNEWIKDSDKTAAYIHMDWAMKWIPQGYREGQVSFFGKKGLPWHIGCVIRRNEGQLEKVNFLHFFDSALQDAEAVAAITDDILLNLKKVHPDIQEAYVRSDNAGCYHSAPAITSLGQLSERFGITIKRMTFLTLKMGRQYVIGWALRPKHTSGQVGTGGMT